MSVMKKIWMVLIIRVQFYIEQRYIWNFTVGFRDLGTCFFPSLGRVNCNSSDKTKHHLQEVDPKSMFLNMQQIP